jgi:hypothetical protein
VVPGIKAGTSGAVARKSEHYHRGSHFMTLLVSKLHTVSSGQKTEGLKIIGGGCGLTAELFRNLGEKKEIMEILSHGSLCSSSHR